MRQRSLWRLYRELYAILEGHRGSIALALATLSVSTLLRLLPPAATKLVIDYVLLRRPLPESVTSRVPIPDDPKARLMLLVAAVLAVSTVGLVDRALGTLAGDPGEQARAGRRPQAGSSSTRSGSRCTGSTSSSRAGPRASSARTPAGSAS